MTFSLTAMENQNYTHAQIAILKQGAKEALATAKRKTKYNTWGNSENLTDRAVYYLYMQHRYLYDLYKDYLPALNIASATQKCYVDFVAMC